MAVPPGIIIETVEMHTGGEPVRIVVSGWPDTPGPTLLDRRRQAMAGLDGIRRFLMHEPRGHFDMYGAVPLPADDPAAAFAVLFLHNAGFSTMCGHATIALGRWAVDSGRVAGRRFGLQCPCGTVEVSVEADGSAAFVSVPAFAAGLDLVVEVPGFGPVPLDIGFGGAFYAILPAARLGLSLDDPVARLTDAAAAVTEAARAVPLHHPGEPELAFLYGTILTDGGDGLTAPSRNVCVFAEREVDRSPTGSGVTARMALAAARGQAAGLRRFASLTGAVFTGEIAESLSGAVRVRVAGKAHYTGSARFTAEADDRLAGGFLLR
ncbi:MAG: proline racemase family protein [Thalassobaculales bacterium]